VAVRSTATTSIGLGAAHPYVRRSQKDKTMYRSLTLFLLLASISLPACHEAHSEHHEAGKYLVTKPLRKDTDLTHEYVAQVRAIQHIELRALEGGYLEGVFVDEGQVVKKGTRMFQIMPMLVNAEVQKAVAEAELTDIEYQNTKLLADKNVVAPNELKMAKAKLDQAKAHVALQSAHKSLTEIKAPFDGLVGRFLVRKGSLLDEGDPLTTMSDTSTVWVYFNVSEAEYLEYQSKPKTAEATQVKLVMANGQTFDQIGKVETIEADFNNETGNLAFRATFPNPNGVLRHGSTGKVVMTVPLKGALIIPQKAAFDVLERKFVFVVDDKNVVHQRPITVATELPHVYVVKSGIDEKDKILVEGLRKVTDGAEIEVDYKEPADVLGHLEVPVE
jgi:membrane fusion protein, multidrug efflux system